MNDYLFCGRFYNLSFLCESLEWDWYTQKLLDEELVFAKKRTVALNVHRNSLVSLQPILFLSPLAHLTLVSYHNRQVSHQCQTDSTHSKNHTVCITFINFISFVPYSQFIFQHSVYQSKVFVVMQLIMSWSFALKCKCLCKCL